MADPPAAAAPAPPSAGRGWGAARRVLGAVHASRGFTTLRDLVPDGGYVDAARLAPLRPLGEGAFGAVELARLDGAAGPLVAVKTLKPELVAERAELDLFLEEARLMRKLAHPRIVAFLGMGGALAAEGGGGGAVVSDGDGKANGKGGAGKAGKDGAAAFGAGAFVVQEYAAGGSLQDLLVERMLGKPGSRAYSHADALRWCSHVARALEYLHERRVVHRDLKLANVLLTAADVSKADAKLCDFGLARLRPKAAAGAAPAPDPRTFTAAQRTASAALRRRLSSAVDEAGAEAGARAGGGAAAARAPAAEMTGATGSYAYMAPEVLRSEPYDESADIFSAGMVFYCLFYRNIPSLVARAIVGEAAGMEVFAEFVAAGWRPPLSAARAPAEVNALIERCWVGPAALRPGAAEVAAGLEAIAAAGVCSAALPGGAPPGGGCCVVS